MKIYSLEEYSKLNPSPNYSCYAVISERPWLEGVIAPTVSSVLWVDPTLKSLLEAESSTLVDITDSSDKNVVGKIFYNNSFVSISDYLSLIDPLKGWDMIRSKRDALLEETDWLVIRHRDQLELNLETALTNEDYQNLLIYRQALRDITQNTSLATLTWPVKPIFE